ncbi:MAG: trimeric intracellular cation channel family protein [Rhodothermaceae bacterium]|nr:trimeric intracellular cation channel family protein [Rhodothermaceae bacterium]
MSETVLYALDLAGTFVFAVSGGLKAVKYELDLLGIVVLAILTGVGGGIIRDVLLGSTPPAVFQEEFYLVVCILGGFVVFLGASHVEPRWREMMIADAIGLGVFAGVGAVKASSFGLGPIGIIMMAGLTATGGGVVRDILVREIPAVIQKDFYASAALAGGIAFLMASFFDFEPLIQLAIAAIITSGLRFYALFSKIKLPKARKPQAPHSKT